MLSDNNKIFLILGGFFIAKTKKREPKGWWGVMQLKNANICWTESLGTGTLKFNIDQYAQKHMNLIYLLNTSLPGEAVIMVLILDITSFVLGLFIEINIGFFIN